MPDGIRPVTAWPRLLAGPIVRRVTTARAHIWICTRMACDARIIAHVGRDVPFDTGASPDRTGPWTTLERLGQRMYMGVLPIDLGLLAGETVSYDIVVREGTTQSGLFQLGLLGGTQGQVGAEFDELRAEVPLGYEDRKLPSFVLPVNHPDALRFVHASCRKPHGGGADEADAMQLVDAQIAASRLTHQEERPQLLVLTGDQVYADDVAPGLLAALTEAGEGLLGWSEDIPTINAATSFLIDPGWRTRFLSMNGIELKELPEKKATDYSGSHLLRFGEWAAMYLFAWSDALWKVIDDAGPKYTLPAPPSLLPLSAVNTIVSTADTLGLPLITGRAASALEKAAELTDFAKELSKAWKVANGKALRYAYSVRAARRALANVATYMMFDDHEITDDWYLDQRVHDKIRGKGGTGPAAEVGPRMLRNGLSAYAFFQHWGNEPDDFAPGRQGAQLLAMWRHTGNPGNTCQLKTTPRAADALLDVGATVAAIPVSRQRSAFTRMRWDYAIDFDKYRLVSLDTRTWRSFPTGEPMSWASLAPKLPVAPGAPADAGATQVAAVAAAWRATGTAAGQLAYRSFADLVDAYRAVAVDIGGSKAVLQTRFTALVAAWDTLLDQLPGRAALAASALRDPVTTFVHRCLDNPTAIAPLFASATDARARETVIQALRDAGDLDFGAASEQLSLLADALADFVDAALRRSRVGMVFAAQRVAANAGTGLAEILANASSSAPASVQAIAAVQIALGLLDQLSDAIGADELAEMVFRNGDSRLAAGLISTAALQFMVTDVLATVGPQAPVTLLLSPAPIFGNRLVEIVQLFATVKLVAQGKAGEEEMDFEAWGCNTAAMNELLRAAKSLTCAIVLSGDVHYAGSSVNEVDVGDARTTYIQLTSSSARNSDSKTRSLARLDDLLYDDNGEMYLLQADWTGQLEVGASQVGHLTNLAWDKVGEAFDAVTSPLQTGRQLVDNFKYWWNGSAITLDDVLETTQRVVTSPLNTGRAVVTEALWEIYSAIDLIRDFVDDPLLKVFGDFLTARQPLREHLRTFYEMTGIDTHDALEIRSTTVFDRRDTRLAFYPEAGRRIKPGTAAAAFTNTWQRRTVGYANAGFVRLVTASDSVREVQHELRFYPIDKAPQNSDPLPRIDWMGSLHCLGWYGAPADIAKGRT